MKAFPYPFGEFIFTFLILCSAIAENALNGSQMEFVVEYFLMKDIKTVTSLLCQAKDINVKLSKLFSKNLISYNWMDLANLDDSKAEKFLALKFPRLGLLIDLNCSSGMDFLQMASKNDYFIFENSPTFWLIIYGNYVDERVLHELTDEYQVKVPDPIEFLLEPYEDKTKESLFYEMNKRLNKDVLDHLDEILGRIQATGKENRTTALTVGSRHPKIKEFLKLKILMDNEVTIAIPGPAGTNVLYTLYDIYKPVEELKPEVNVIGVALKNLNAETFKKMDIHEKPQRNFRGALLRAGCMIFQPDFFTTLDDLSSREVDIWEKMSYEHVKILGEELDFRMVIRFFIDYGWEVNGTFTHLLGSFKKKKSIISASAALMRAERLNVIDYTICPFRFEVGIMFKEPSLSSVNNIFVLPFSSGMWLSIGLLIWLVMIAMSVRPFALRLLRLSYDSHESDLSEIIIYILGAICQQGFSTSSKAASDRTIIIFLLLTSLILFSAYSACVVALLQSSSSAITSIRDMTKSNFEVGIQAHFPVLNVIMKEAKNPILREYIDKKIKHKRGELYFEVREGIKRMRNRLFAFEVDLNSGYNVIRQTFLEQEKCGIKVLDLSPKPYICFPVGKGSSYKKLFTRRLIWQQEIGLIDRSWKLWMDVKPKCEVDRAAFISVGITEIKPLIWIFLVGVSASLVVFALELFLSKISVGIKFRKKIQEKIKTLLSGNT